MTATLLPDDPDLRLIRAIAGRDGEALAQLFDRFAPGLNGLALRIVGDPADAEEVVADAFAQVWREAGRFDPRRGSLAAWLVTMTRSRALDLVRARGRRGRLVDAAAQESAVGPVAMGRAPASPNVAAELDERANRVRTAMQNLPDEQRTVLELAYFEGLSQSEIAERLATPLGTVKTRARLALGKLRDMLRTLAPDGHDG
jgi:RNA polymerase sigma-70 factor (ECF subfamily)